MLWYFILLINLLQVFLIGTTILLENRSPGNTMTWIVILALLPGLGFILYTVFGKKTRGEIFRNKHIQDNQIKPWVRDQRSCTNSEEMKPSLKTDSALKLVNLHINSGFAPLTQHNQVDILLNGGEKFQELFNALETAVHHIHLSYYIFNDDEIGKDVLKILARKVTEGVEVRVILDGMGSHSISGSFINSMRKAGIQANWFFPIRFPYLTSKLNLRYHRKIVVVDGSIGFLGGLNIGDEYMSRDSKLGFWRDTHLRIQGKAVQTLQAIFLNDWYFVTHQEINGERYYPETKISQNLPIQILASGPDSKWKSILHSFFSSITMAQHCIKIETPYFIPDKSLIMALKTAALSGIDVRLIVQGIPENKLTFLAMNSYFEELLQSGIKIFQYMKGTLHAKILIVDNHLALVGSANMDMRSFFLDFEVSAYIYDQSTSKRLIDHFEMDLEECSEIKLEEIQSRSFIERVKESSARILSPLL
ncbi:cardiolipin synthase [Desulfosporosinus meridiei]|uniref:Cardiolipin synthase n=1 Tax=Desulfosporosinus meridiei (strain ATCC BAA-275 / DSM 13257 / KCTC 12902 / NCIMB 13706 / S10) TaxID=768704 RepID=J7IYH3_DESMD|nr:cardiolipin synthase [Desulfosporosinus meridiei]AFQ44153.1 phosphatidylserine/phosphatidylglycerophosphate/cardiolipin synthase [Desulfosporosinus meridiei DSM 13257]